MKKIYIILFFIPFISCCQTDTEFILQKKLLFEWGKDYCISKNDCFFLDMDTNGVIIMSYSSERYKNKQAIDSIDDAGLYGTALYSFQNETDNSYVVLWKNEGEYNPYFNIYYLSKGKVVKIGEWMILIPHIVYNCEYCDYSAEDILIHQKNNEIEFSFLNDTDFVILREYSNYDDWGTFKAGKLKVSFNIVDGTVKKVNN